MPEITWTKIDPSDPATLPEQKVVLAAYRNACGNSRIVRALNIKPFGFEASDDFDEDWCDWKDDVWYLKPGWYEWPEEVETTATIPHDVTHWAPLPKHPEEKKEAPDADA